LRTRFNPRSRIGRGLVSVAPWLDIVLVLLFFVLIDRRLVLQPGTVVSLPTAGFEEGERPNLVAVAFSVRGVNGGPHKDVVFFDDERFLLGEREQVQKFKTVLAQEAREHPDAALTIQADAAMPHGTVMQLMRMARDVGIPRVNIAARPR
jgi:biopolymer transport protein ExbD